MILYRNIITIYGNIIILLTSETMSSPVSACPPPVSGLVEERMADWMPVMKTWAVLSLSSVQLSAPESDTTEDSAGRPERRRRIISKYLFVSKYFLHYLRRLRETQFLAGWVGCPVWPFLVHLCASLCCEAATPLLVLTPPLEKYL